MKKLKNVNFLFSTLLLITCPTEIPQPPTPESTREATVPWITYEAEIGTTNGSVLTWNRESSDGVGDPAGYGNDYTLTIFVNDEKTDTLQLTSRYSWLYGNENTPSENPGAGRPRRIYDESRLLLSRALEPGDKL